MKMILLVVDITFVRCSTYNEIGARRPVAVHQQVAIHNITEVWSCQVQMDSSQDGLQPVCQPQRPPLLALP